MQKHKRKPRKKTHLLPVMRPNVGIRAAYRRAMEYQINLMCDDVERQLREFFNGRENRLAYTAPQTAEDGWFDDLPSILSGGRKKRNPSRTVAEMLSELMESLKGKWSKKFETAAKGMVQTFINGIFKRCRASRKQSLIDAGIKIVITPEKERISPVGGTGIGIVKAETGEPELEVTAPSLPFGEKIKKDKESLRKMGVAIPFDKSLTTNEWFQAAIQRNVGLIKTIPEQYLGKVNEMVMQSITAGYDRAGLQKEIYTLLTEKLSWERDKALKRANIIARDQSQKATQEFTRHTDIDNGITKGKWVHIPGRLMSRPTHIEMNGKEFDLRVGLYDPDPKVKKEVKPGELILCACGYRAVIPDDWF